jgi:hypothetical protein
MSERNMKKKNDRKTRQSESGKETMRSEYDFSHADRGVTAARYAEGTNVILLDPDMAKIFPDARAVNEALRTLARLRPISTRQRSRKRTA